MSHIKEFYVEKVENILELLQQVHIQLLELLQRVCKWLLVNVLT
jgi:predicted RNA-binding protein with RPS1 domain